MNEEGVKELRRDCCGSGAKCISCNAPIDFAYIRQQGRGYLGETMMAIVAEGDRQRAFISPNENTYLLLTPLDPGFIQRHFSERQGSTYRYMDLMNSGFVHCSPTYYTYRFKHFSAEVQTRAEQDALAMVCLETICHPHGGKGNCLWSGSWGVFGFSVDQVANHLRLCVVGTLLNAQMRSVFR